MNPSRHLRMLTRYSAWANEVIFDTVAALPAGVATEKLKTLFGTMVNTLNHNYVVDQIWQAHLQRRGHGFTKRITETEPAFADLRAGQARLDAWYIDYADTLTDAGAAEVLDFDFVDGGSSAMSRADMLLHVVNHKTYHRGWVAEQMFASGVRPPAIDLPVFLRDAVPASPRWRCDN